ncbi:hypothetical protein [Acinetobacter gyllenbergii]|uniref:Uncharacterized protein n=2 Tax=Acinetobacter gyllenbergii TaxID=134534 RepID=A0A829HHC4_9GAMM|nr:hypothetical protein [Acinetobacter gyllenbergii]EPF77276.1 hypothetical protein F957_02754 [Acinetobacter gyllenbergii CIP 110306 = MTCC 11365]
MMNNSEQLFELFYQDIRPDMNPPGFPKYRSDAMFSWWRDRFMNAYHGIQEPYALRNWGETPQMWLAGYKKGLNINR